MADSPDDECLKCHESKRHEADRELARTLDVMTELDRVSKDLRTTLERIEHLAALMRRPL